MEFIITIWQIWKRQLSLFLKTLSLDPANVDKIHSVSNLASPATLSINHVIMRTSYNFIKNKWRMEIDM